MSFPTDLEGVQMNSGSIPAGRYNLRIVEAVEKVSKNGDPMVVVNYEVMDGQFIGRHVKFHYVVFFKDKTATGAGMSKAFLKTIDQPHDGKVVVDSTKWIGRCVTAKVVLERGQDGNEYARVKFVDKYVTDFTALPKTDAAEEEDPFGPPAE